MEGDTHEFAIAVPVRAGIPSSPFLFFSSPFPPFLCRPLSVSGKEVMWVVIQMVASRRRRTFLSLFFFSLSFFLSSLSPFSPFFQNQRKKM